MEKWVEIEGFPSYMVSDAGRVWSKHRKRCLKPKVTRKGYYFFHLSHEGKHAPRRLGRLVAQAFIENPNNYPVVNHKDGDKTNNAASNLEWTTYQENTKHAYRMGLMKRALSDEQIEEVKKLYASGNWTQDALAKKYNISKSTVNGYVRNVKNHRHHHKSGGIPVEIKRKIKQLYLTGQYTQKELAKRFNVSRASVSNCVRL